jgi:hypothetical protein
MTMDWRIVLAVGLAVLLSACMTPIHPRTAEIAPPGGFIFDTHIALLTGGPATTRATGVRTEGGTSRRAFTLEGVLGAAFDPSSAAGIPPVWWEFSGHLGVLPGCDVCAIVGILRLGGEARCGPLDQREGAPFSLAVGGALAWVPFIKTDAVWWRSTLDISRRFGQWQAMTNLALSHGPEGYLSIDAPPVIFWDAQPDPNVSDDPGAGLELVRTEWRLAAALGFAVTASDPDQQALWFVMGVVPYVVLDASPLSRTTCDRCPTVEVDAFEHSHGLSLTVGIAGM